jgi:hypothetical protein
LRRLSSVGLAEDAAKNETSAVGEHVLQLAERYLSRGAKTPVPFSRRWAWPLSGSSREHGTMDRLRLAPEGSPGRPMLVALLEGGGRAQESPQNAP